MPMRLIAKWLLNALVVILVAYLLPGVDVSGFYAALIVALLLGLVNITLKPLLILLTLPINILTLGLFTFVINALMLLFVSSIVKGFSVSGFAAAFIGALIISILNWLITNLLREEREH